MGSWFPGSRRGRVYVTIAVIAVIGVIGSIYAASGEDHGIRCEGCNVVYVSIDPLRADHVGVYGYGRNTTPNIDRVAAESFVFERAFTHAGHTLPSMVSTMSSTYPSQHNVFPGRDTSALNLSFLPGVLQRHGYDTFYAGGANNVATERMWDGFDAARAFGVHNESMISHIREQVASDGRFFYMVQSYRPHDPYFAPGNLSGMFSPFYAGFEREMRSLWQDILSREPQPWWRMRPNYFPPAEGNESLRQHLVARYDEAVRWADRRVGRVVEVLKEEGVYDDTVLIIGSQHGEEFLEHGNWRHSFSLYNEVMHVPLIVRVPGMEEPRRIGETVRNVDVFPSVLDLLGINAENLSSRFVGQSLIPLMEGREDEPRPVFATNPSGNSMYMDPSGVKVMRMENETRFYNISADFEELHVLNRSRALDAVVRREQRLRDALAAGNVSFRETWPYVG